MKESKSGTTLVKPKWQIPLADYDVFNDLLRVAERHPKAEFIWGEEGTCPSLEWTPIVEGSVRQLSNGTLAYIYLGVRDPVVARMMDIAEITLAKRMRNWFQMEAEPVKAVCLVCGCQVFARSNFAKATGKALCKKASCREEMVNAGIV